MKLVLDNFFQSTSVKHRQWLMFFAALLLVLNAVAQFPERPSPPRLINDFAGFLTEGERQKLEQKLVAYDDSTSSQISIVCITDLGSYDISSYAFELGEKWGIGRSGKNNGVLILAAKNQREVFIATGYGLEDVLPDAICKRIVERIIIPLFKTGDFYEGFDAATDEIIARGTGKYVNDTTERKGFPIWAIILIVILIIIISSLSSGKGGKTMSLGRGFRGGSGGPVIWGGGGGFGGGSSSGGGFGGFGGGSFGGGGAGGKW